MVIPPRWQQRLQNFNKAFRSLQEAIHKKNLSELERNGLIQRFEYTIELAWKLLKDYLQAQGFSFPPNPKTTVRTAQTAGVIDYAQALIDGLDIRNNLSHDYSEKKFEASEIVIRKEIFPALTKLHQYFLDKKQS